MKQILILICWLLPAVSFAQQKKDLPFQKFENWKSVLAEAKEKKKKIFVDAFATWCGPCKQMDLEVYTDTDVMSFLDSNFISLKVQMDRTEPDSPEVKSWYDDAAMLLKEYNITSFPSFIFLNQEGQLIQISKGYLPANDFLGLLRSINNPKEWYVNQIAMYKTGRVPTKMLLKLALKAKEYGQDSLATEIARKYKTGYLIQQKLTTVVNPDLMLLLGNFPQILSLNDVLINYSYKNPLKFDSLMQRKGSAIALIDFYVNRDMVQPMLDIYEKASPETAPDWVNIEKKIAKSYDSRTAERITINRQIGYYHAKKDWENIVKYEIKKVDLFGLDTAGMGKTRINNLVYGIFFLHINNPDYLNKAISYMDVIVAAEPERAAWLDTYANILYKSGQWEKAIRYQEKALEIAAKRKYEGTIREYSETLRKMKANQPTWMTSQP